MHNNYRNYYPHKYPHPPPLPHKNQACLSYKDNFLLMFIIIMTCLKFQGHVWYRNLKITASAKLTPRIG